jgi:hypothetical protein
MDEKMLSHPAGWNPVLLRVYGFHRNTLSTKGLGCRFSKVVIVA